MKRISLIFLIISAIFTSCENGKWEFPDYDTSAVYFAYQTPVRTITLGTDDVNDNTLDNQHKCQIMATVAGFREIKNDIEISFRVENSLCNGLDNVTAMPSNYYSLSDNKMVISKGSKMIGGVTVTLTDAFFADPLALTTNYVIPLIMTDVKNADGILTGEAAVENPNRFIPEDWVAAPKDYILFAVKYLNPYDVIYLRRGTDNYVEDGVPRTEERKGPYATPEGDEVIRLSSISMTEIAFPVDNFRANNVNLNMAFKLTFDPATNKCTFANGAWKDSQLVNEYAGENFKVYDIVISGSGEYVKGGAKNSWGNKDRDILNLNYQVEYKVEQPIGSDPKTVKCQTADGLVFRDRGVAIETFEPELKP